MFRARDYFWREVGGLLFLMHRYKTAAWAYCRAIEEQGDQGSDSYLVRLLHADCLMFSGQYAIAISELENSLEPRASHEDAEWVLKLEALRWLVSRFGIRSGSRNVRAAIERMATVGFSDATLEASCLDALTLDALCSQSWGKLGVHYSNLEKDNNEMRRTAAMCLMMGALCSPHDIYAWVNVIISFASVEGTETLLMDCIWAVSLIHGDNAFAELIERVGDASAMFAELIEIALSGSSQSRPEVSLRFHRGDATWDLVTIAG